ncbi:hypothetical protein [Thermoanaerobacterium thermosaccharolyticum]|jgi:hypothetical protein|uniref:Uncharacterized protein n=1 Tax=Thermoanaerobacterium thermosaccharolyticum (strain ATCC 7956 / DSM 571 / NCIMB 9385 / NCA 3814 / NCTC 13789 / WDCM 00135 / 2032) TaxID=580327 RepID=D9TQ63_THETC|nr:hypothetical protein [Thermoanaerobacterium thermosaccharolyticum]ADL67850.1 hypothetical protein Tthe_0275 [Thermoanaerobacterium thermosaccharolyticum DSM 571]TCW42584.1 hypothetical protein EDC21_101200 [Thermohydrogenium kirishiense]
MWAEFRPIKNKDLLIKIAEGLMRITPIRIEKVGEGWKLMIKT